MKDLRFALDQSASLNVISKIIGGNYKRKTNYLLFFLLFISNQFLIINILSYNNILSAAGLNLLKHPLRSLLDDKDTNKFENVFEFLWICVPITQCVLDDHE